MKNKTKKMLFVFAFVVFGMLLSLSLLKVGESFNAMYRMENQFPRRRKILDTLYNIERDGCEETCREDSKCNAMQYYTKKKACRTLNLRSPTLSNKGDFKWSNAKHGLMTTTVFDRTAGPAIATQAPTTTTTTQAPTTTTTTQAPTTTTTTQAPTDGMYASCPDQTCSSDRDLCLWSNWGHPTKARHTRKDLKGQLKGGWTCIPKAFLNKGRPSGFIDGRTCWENKNCLGGRTCVKANPMDDNKIGYCAK